YFVADRLPDGRSEPIISHHTRDRSVGHGIARTPTHGASAPDWSGRMRYMTGLRAIAKPREWQSYPYPFIYGQFDPALFPTADWRECTRMALAVLEIRGWASDLIDRDDPLLIEQLQKHILPRRGVWASSDEIMVTLGAQNALYLLADLLMKHARVGLEEPGYSDA